MHVLIKLNKTSSFLTCLCFFIFGSSVLSQEVPLRFEHLTVENGLSQNSIHSITQDKFGFMWFGTWEGANRFDGYTFKIFRADEEDHSSLSNNRIDAIFTDSLGNLWVQTADQQHLFKFNFKSESFAKLTWIQAPSYLVKLLNHSKGYPSKIVQHGNYQWQATLQGLMQTNLQSKEQRLLQSDPNNYLSLSDHIINTVYIDNSENLWIGTQNGGINKAYLRSKPFMYFHASTIPGEGLCDNVIRAICKDHEGNLWVGTDHHGITVIHNSKPISFSYFNKKDLISEDIRSLFCDRFGFVWIGTKGGLSRYDPRTRSFRRYYAGQPGSIPHPWVFWVMEDYCGYLWIGTFNGIAKYNRKSDQFLAIDPNKTLKNKNVRSIIEDRKFNLWVATEGGGITKLQRDSSKGFNETFTPTHFQHQPNNSNSLINNQVLTMVEDSAGMLWIGTNSGLCRMNPDSNTFRRFSVKTGFPDDLIMGLLFDGKHHLWISHKRGISRLNTSTFEVRNFDKHDGLQGNEFNQNAYFQDKQSGEMFFGGTNGLNAFIPDSIKDNPFAPKIVLTSLQILNQEVGIQQKINGHVVLNQSLLFTKEITLTWWDKSFSIGFSALHYANPQGNKFKYRLEGFEKQWIYTDANRRVASYANLLPGTYAFTVFAANSDGLWSSQPAILTIHVLPPWWLSGWAWMAYLILFLTISWFIYRYIIARIEFRKQIWLEKVKNEKNEELHQLKLQFFTNISHEFRTPLTLIIDPLEKLLSDDNQASIQTRNFYILMHRNAQRMLGLINQLLDFRKIESGQQPVHPSFQDAVLLIRNVFEAFEFRAKQHQIGFSFQTSVKNLNVGIDANKLDKILVNLISNAFKYTPDGGQISVDLSYFEVDKSIQIKVADTGVGIPLRSLNKIFDAFYQVDKGRQADGTGIGLAFTKELVQLLNGEITVSSEEGKGSCFTVRIPFISPSAKTIFSDETKSIEALGNLTSGVLEFDENVADTSSPLILIVEDNDDVRFYLKTNLGNTYQVIETNNGASGLKKAMETIPDLIVSDIMMPEMDGIELCRRLKTDERTSHIPVVLLSAKQSDQSRVEGYETGADAYITKPFNSDVLLACIKNLIDSRLRLRQLFSKGTPFELKKLAINLTDEAFFVKITKLIEENLENPDFDTDALAEKLKMSRSQLYRKMKGLTNQSVFDFTTAIRMNKALELLLSGAHSISEVAYKVGFSLPTNFTRTFVKQFGQTPTAYIDSIRKEL